MTSALAVTIVSPPFLIMLGALTSWPPITAVFTVITGALMTSSSTHFNNACYGARYYGARYYSKRGCVIAGDMCSSDSLYMSNVVPCTYIYNDNLRDKKRGGE